VTHWADGVRGVQTNVPIAPLTTYKLGGPAAWLVEVGSDRHLDEVLEALPPDVDVLVLGRGSNLVVADGGFDGLVMRLVGDFVAIEVLPDGTVHAGGAAALPRVARAAAAAGRCGLEFYAGIPGSVGGAVMMNAGGHGSDTAEHLMAASVVDLRSGGRSERAPEDLGLGYRRSNLGSGQVVTAARFSTAPCSTGAAEARIREITRWRKEHQPGGTFNAGSVFKNPQGDAAGRLIDEAGLKGFRCGGVAVSEMHANFFVADDDASAQDVWDLVSAVRRRVAEATGVWLTPEVRFAGAFDEGSGDAMEPETTA
jgi:UDP-N-acetylmuramate dehydrogenase